MNKIATSPKSHKDLKFKTYNKNLTDQLERIERMLKWLCVRLNIESLCNAGFHTTSEKAGELLKEAEMAELNLPDISDILKDSTDESPRGGQSADENKRRTK